MSDKYNYTVDELDKMRVLLQRKISRYELDNKTGADGKYTYNFYEIALLGESRLQSCILAGITYKDLAENDPYTQVIKDNPDLGLKVP